MPEWPRICVGRLAELATLELSRQYFAISAKNGYNANGAVAVAIARVRTELDKGTRPMSTEIHGQHTVKEQRFAIVVSRFNDFITSKLLSGAKDTITRNGGTEDNITCIHVPGAFELPFMAKKVAETGKYDAVICLGCVIRGQTPHFDYVAGEAAKGIAQVGLSTGVPTTFGVITCDTLEQAVERAGSKAGNKGVDATLSAIELSNLLSQLTS